MTRTSSPLSKRRLYVLFYALALVVLYPLAHEYLGLMAVFIFFAASPLYYGGSTIVSALRNKRLDEREQQLAYEGFKIAYEILVTTLLVSLAVSQFSAPPKALETLNDFFLLNSEVLLNVWTLLLLAVVLPVCVIAWLEPDLINEELNAEFQTKKVSESA